MPARSIVTAALATSLALHAGCSRAPAAGPAPSPSPVDGFDFPVGPPDGRGFVVTQGFQDGGTHLGEDWNGPGGGDTDLGTPIHALADGVVSLAADLGDNGWGRVVRVVHPMPDGSEVESLSAHLARIDVAEGDRVVRGQVLGAMGTAHGRYSAHLHLELRSMARLPVGAGYGDPAGLYLAPSPFISAHRPRPATPRSTPDR